MGVLMRNPELLPRLCIAPSGFKIITIDSVKFLVVAASEPLRGWGCLRSRRSYTAYGQ